LKATPLLVFKEERTTSAWYQIELETKDDYQFFYERRTFV
jgi:hypothetical protein